MAEWIVLGVVGLIILRGVMKGVDVYGAFLTGGKQGMESALGLLPALCAMMLLLAAMNASGLNELLAAALSPVLRILNLPQETASVLLLRPLSGSGSMAALQQVFDQCGLGNHLLHHDGVPGRHGHPQAAGGDRRIAGVVPDRRGGVRLDDMRKQRFSGVCPLR